MPQQLAERDVTLQVKHYLEHRGWRAIRHQRTAIPGAFSTGEPGIPDFQFCFYFDKPQGAAAVLWIEFKSPRPGSKLSEHQRSWQQREHARGAVVLTVHCFEDFEPQYRALFGWIKETVGQQELALVEEKW